MDKRRYPEAHVVLAKFNYWAQTLLMVPFAVPREDLVFYGSMENPRMLRCVLFALLRITTLIILFAERLA